MKIAVITGASSGIGREFALQLDRAETFDEMWLIARRTDRLEALGRELCAHVRVLGWDLTDPAAFDLYRILLEREKPEIAVLVNASGFGFFRAFTEDPLPDQLRMIDLNDKALVSMTYLSLPYMSAGSRIYEMGSLSSFQPVPYINLYAATKAFVLSFSRALNTELRPRGIRVLAVCPGWIRTEFFDTAIRDKTISFFNRYYEAKDVAARAIRDMKRGKDISVLGFPVRMQVLGVKLLPHRLVMRIWCRQQKQPY